METKETLKEVVLYIIRKKTVYFLLFLLLAILAVRSDFSCGWVDGKFNFNLQVKNLDRTIMKSKIHPVSNPQAVR